MADKRLTKHENLNFSDEVLYLSGHAYLGCTFERCTLFVTNTPFYIEGCTFSSCNWRLEVDLLWGDEDTRTTIRQILSLMEDARETS